jgi:hypothetical protein
MTRELKVISFSRNIVQKGASGKTAAPFLHFKPTFDPGGSTSKLSDLFGGAPPLLVAFLATA